MSSIDLAILGLVMEKPKSAYDIKCDVETENYSQWTQISIPSIYKKVLSLKEKGYLKSSTVKGERSADKAIYSITPKGREYFAQLMNSYSGKLIPLLFDFNVVISNLNKVDKQDGLRIINRLRGSIANSAWENEENSEIYVDVPLVSKTIFDQQRLIYKALSEWINEFEKQYEQEEPVPAKNK